MNDQPIRMGWLSLLTVLVIICVSVLSVLSFSTARADLRFAQKQAETVRHTYALEREGQGWYEQQDAALSAGTGEGRAQTTLENVEGRKLEIALEARSGHYKIMRWRHTAMWTEPVGQQTLLGAL